MAIRYAVASGNWSNPAIWDGGTLPGAGDDVYCNSRIVTIDQNITVNSLRNHYDSGGITATSTTHFVVPATGATVLTINAIIQGHAIFGQAQYPVLRLLTSASNYNVVLNGDIVGNTEGQVATDSMIAGQVAVRGTFTINGNIQIHNAGSSQTYPVVRLTGDTVAPYLSVVHNGNIVALGIPATTIGRAVRVVSANYTWNGYIVRSSTEVSTTVGVILDIANTALPSGVVVINAGSNVLSRPRGTASSTPIQVVGGSSMTVNASAIDSEGGNVIGLEANGAPCTITVTADLITSSGTSAGTPLTVVCQTTAANSTYTFTGNITRQSATAVLFSGMMTITAVSAMTCVINGNIPSGGHGYGVVYNVSATGISLTINGNIGYGNSAGSSGVYVGGTSQASSVAVNGIVDCTSPANQALGGAVVHNSITAATLGTAPAMLRCNGIVFNPYGVLPCNRGFYISPTGSVTMPTASGNVTLADVAAGVYPPVSDVRQGTSYGNGLVGVAGVPAAALVKSGIPVGTVVGTHQCTGVDGILTG